TASTLPDSPGAGIGFEPAKATAKENESPKAAKRSVFRIIVLPGGGWFPGLDVGSCLGFHVARRRASAHAAPQPAPGERARPPPGSRPRAGRRDTPTPARPAGDSASRIRRATA